MEGGEGWDGLWVMSELQDRDYGWAWKECRREEGMKKEGKRAVRDNGVAAFISLWIVAGEDRQRDGYREGGKALYLMAAQSSECTVCSPSQRKLDNISHWRSCKGAIIKRFWSLLINPLIIWCNLFFSLLVLILYSFPKQIKYLRKYQEIQFHHVTKEVWIKKNKYSLKTPKQAIRKCLICHL